MQPTRDDIIVKPHAELMGFTAEVDNQGLWKEGVPMNPYSYTQLNDTPNPEFKAVQVWKCSRGWASAKLSNEDRYTDHGYYTKPEAALARAYDWLAKDTRIMVHSPEGHTFLTANGETAYYTLSEAQYSVAMLTKVNTQTNVNFTVETIS